MACFGYTQTRNENESESTTESEGKEIVKCTEDEDPERVALFKLLISSVSNRSIESNFSRSIFRCHIRRLSTIFEASCEGDVNIPMCAKE